MSLRIDPSESDFLNMRREQLLYVDKTAQIRKFLESGKAQLFTRPRRFGKSLLLSTIKAMYGGDPSVFAAQTSQEADLAVYRDPAWNWQARPVLHLDMTAIRMARGSIVPGLSERVALAANKAGMKGYYEHNPLAPAYSLTNLLIAMWQRHRTVADPDFAQVVVLVDEYDAPLLDSMHAAQGAEIRSQLADFYSAFMMETSVIHRLVMTGITRFVREGLWSKLNHVTDRSQDPRFHDLVGFTDADLDMLWLWQEKNGPRWTDRHGEVPLTRQGWQEWYNGYRFTETARYPLYNPFAIIHSLDKGHLGDFWAMSGSLGAVETLLTGADTEGTALPIWLPAHTQDWDYALDMESWNDLDPGETAQDMLRQWDASQLTTLLHQTGYLSLKPEGGLAMPNREVAMHMAAVRLRPYLNRNMRRAQRHLQRMYRALKHLNMPELIQAYNNLLHQFPHQRFHRADDATFNLFFDLSVVKFPPLMEHDMEHSGLQGAGDTMLLAEDVALIVEFRLGPSHTAADGMAQIVAREYPRAVPQTCAMYLGVAIEIRDRQAVHWMCDGFTEDGERMHRTLHDTDVWPQAREDLYQRWGTASAPTA